MKGDDVDVCDTGWFVEEVATDFDESGLLISTVPCRRRLDGGGAESGAATVLTMVIKFKKKERKGRKIRNHNIKQKQNDMLVAVRTNLSKIGGVL